MGTDWQESRKLGQRQRDLFQGGDCREGMEVGGDTAEVKAVDQNEGE